MTSIKTKEIDDNKLNSCQQEVDQVVGTSHNSEHTDCHESDGSNLKGDKGHNTMASHLTGQGNTEPSGESSQTEIQPTGPNNDISGKASPGIDAKSPSLAGGSSKNRTFPVKLMKILDSEEYKDVFAWTKSGKSFSIYKPYDLISKVLVVHFDGKCDMKFDSFLRKLYRWGFTKRSSSDEIDGEGDGGQVYFHENFQRGNYKLCALMNCNSKPTTNRPLAKGTGMMHAYNPYVHGMFNGPPMEFGFDPIQMQLKLQQQQYLTRLYQQQQMQNLTAQNSLRYPQGGQASHGIFMRQRPEQEMILLQQQQQWQLANLAQPQAHPVAPQFQAFSGLPGTAQQSFGYLPNNMYNIAAAQQSMGSGIGAINGQRKNEAMDTGRHNRASDEQFISGANSQMQSNGSNGSDIPNDSAKIPVKAEDASPAESGKRKNEFDDAAKEKVQRLTGDSSQGPM